MSSRDVFSPNKSIDAAIKQMLPEFDEQSQGRMKKAIRDAGGAALKYKDENSDAGARHKFREFIPAYVLNRCGYSLQYESRIDGKTPDWLDRTEGLLLESLTFERGGTSPFAKRVPEGVALKCCKYSILAARHSLSIVVSVYLDFLTGIELDECREERTCFRDLFHDHPSLWGILFFTEQYGGVLIGQQPYRFLCLTSDPSLKAGTNWHIPTFNVGD